MEQQLGGWRPFAAHFFWTHHISTLLRRSDASAPDGTARARTPLRVGFVSQAEVEFNLARFFEFGNDCMVDTAPVREKLSARLDKMSAKLTPSPFYGNEPRTLGLGYAPVGHLSSRGRQESDRKAGGDYEEGVVAHGIEARTAGGLVVHKPELRNVSWLAAQCPHALRSGRSLQCPWYSNRCSESLQHRVKQMLSVARKLRGH